jgi:uracil-DNA glycosylase
MFDKISDWLTVFNSAKLIEQIKSINDQLYKDSKSFSIYPSNEDVFKAFELCKFNDLKVVIIGQDPYHGEGQAHGLAFSVPEAISMPPSLKNIFKELSDDLNIPISSSGNLERWARQGVLLLNSVLTVKKEQAGSHRNIGWERITDHVINTISIERENVVFILWGNYAKEKEQLINKEKHLILTAAHPSPLSAYKGFFGCRHFSKTNAYLRSNGIREIDW